MRRPRSAYPYRPYDGKWGLLIYYLRIFYTLDVTPQTHTIRGKYVWGLKYSYLVCLHRRILPQLGDFLKYRFYSTLLIHITPRLAYR